MRKINYLFLLIIVFLLSGSLSFAQSTSRRRAAAPSTYQLTVNANVAGYQVMIDGKAIKGNSVTLEAATYAVTVRANGYFDWQTTVDLNSDKTIMATLNPMQYQLSIDSNIRGARVFIDSNPQGQIKYSDQLRPGTYNVRVSEFGYQDFTTSVDLNQDLQIYANLEPAYAAIQININSSILNSKDKGAGCKVEIYVNGTRQNGRSFQLLPGQHVIQIVSGGFSAEETFTFQPGQSYTIEPSFGLSIK